MRTATRQRWPLARRQRRRHRMSFRTRMRVLAVVAGLGWVGWLWFQQWWPAHRAAVLHILAWVGVLLVVVAAGVGALLFRLAAARKNSRREARRSIAYADATGRDGKGLEELVADLLVAQDLRDVVVSGGAGDLGADVVGWAGRLKVVVQCKRYGAEKRVGSKDMQAFLGTCWTEHRADIALFVTTAAGFTQAAAGLAERNGVLAVARDELGRVMAGQRPLIPPQLLAGQPALAIEYVPTTEVVT
jgi:restriction system protein